MKRRWPTPRDFVWLMKTPERGELHGIVSGDPKRMGSYEIPGRERSAGSFPAARRGGQLGSPAMLYSGEVVAWGAQPRAVPSMSGLSGRPLSLRFVTKTPTTTSCSCQVLSEQSPASRYGEASMRFSSAGGPSREP